MPIYEFWCDTHGRFEQLRPMRDYAEPSACPACGVASPRVLFTPPRLAAADRATVRAHERNERAAHAPARASSGHGPGCGCCAGPSKTGAAAGSQQGGKTFPGRRPWMISH